MTGGETYLSGTSFSVEDYVDLPGWGAVQGMCILPNGNMLVSRLGCGVFGVRPWGAGSVKVPLPPDVRSPKGLALLGDGSVLICDAASHCLWAAAPSGAACRLFLGSPNVSGWRDGAAGRVLLRNPSAVAVSADGSVVGVADTGNHCVRIVQVGSDGCAQSVATVGGRGGVGGYLDGVAGRSLFNAPCSVTWSRRFMVVCDAGNHCVRLLAEEAGDGGDGDGDSTWRTSTVAGCGRAGLRDGRAAAAMFNHPCGATFAASGALLVADKNNSRIRAVRAGVVSTLSGALGRGSREGCPLARAQYNAPAHVMCLGVNDTIFVADAGSGKIKLVRKDRESSARGTAAEQPPHPLILGAAPSSPSHNVVSFVHPGAAAQAAAAAAAAAKRSPGGQGSASPRERRKAAVPVFARRASASPKAERAEWVEEPSPQPQPQPPSRRRTGAPAAQPPPPAPPETIGASLAEKEVAGVYQRWAGVSGSGLSCTAWLRFLGACRLLGAEQAGVRRVSTAAAGLIFFGASGGGTRLDFEGFCRALNKLAASFEPRMQPAKLMWSHILPHHHHSSSRGDAAAAAAAADASDVLEPHLLLLLTLNEDVFLRLFKHFVAKGHSGGGGGAGGVTDRMLNMHGWLAFLRRFRVLPDLLNRGAAEAHAVLSVEGALFVALVSPAAAGYADSDADVLRRHNAPTDFATAGYRRPDAPLLLSFPEFLEAVCRVAASCYGRTAWDRRSHPTPYHQLAALISSLNVSPAADEFAAGARAPLFQVPPAPQPAEEEAEAAAVPATPTSEEGVGVGLASPMTALAEGYEERFNDKAPDVPVLRPSLLGALGGGGGGSPEEDGLECDVRSAVQEALAMLPLSEIAALDVKLRPSFVGRGGGGGGSAGWAVRQQGGGSVGDPCDSVEQMRREELAKVVARYERARARMLEEAVHEEVEGGAVTPPLTSAAKLRDGGGRRSSRRKSAKAGTRGVVAVDAVPPPSPPSAPASARGPTPHPDVVAAPSASALSDLSGISAIYSVGGGGGGVGEEVSVEPITLDYHTTASSAAASSASSSTTTSTAAGTTTSSSTLAVRSAASISRTMSVVLGSPSNEELRSTTTAGGRGGFDDADTLDDADSLRADFLGNLEHLSPSAGLRTEGTSVGGGGGGGDDNDGYNDSDGAATSATAYDNEEASLQVAEFLDRSSRGDSPVAQPELPATTATATATATASSSEERSSFSESLALLGAGVGGGSEAGEDAASSLQLVFDESRLEAGGGGGREDPRSSTASSAAATDSFTSSATAATAAQASSVASSESALRTVVDGRGDGAGGEREAAPPVLMRAAAEAGAAATRGPLPVFGCSGDGGYDVRSPTSLGGSDRGGLGIGGGSEGDGGAAGGRDLRGRGGRGGSDTPSEGTVSPFIGMSDRDAERLQLDHSSCDGAVTPIQIDRSDDDTDDSTTTTTTSSSSA